jgi:hypothetical protein
MASAMKKPLTKEDKKKNKELSSERVLNENVIGMIKLIAGIYNFELEN